jgi:hypothetical protein
MRWIGRRSVLPGPLTSADAVPLGLGTAADVTGMIAAQLDDVQARFAAIGPGHQGDSTASQSSGAQPGFIADIRTPATGNGTGRDGKRGRPPRGIACRTTMRGWKVTPRRGRGPARIRSKRYRVRVPLRHSGRVRRGL